MGEWRNGLKEEIYQYPLSLNIMKIVMENDIDLRYSEFFKLQTIP
ncbi:hypothetical protein CoNPh17_CDS0022 [Staphylococcus phage S-CoN_Ph17]|nr:hypothetical protein CoNPh17_CDS0022 [Staphylococcus phage S-CoN_Ph17]